MKPPMETRERDDELQVSTRQKEAANEQADALLQRDTLFTWYYSHDVETIFLQEAYMAQALEFTYQILHNTTNPHSVRCMQQRHLASLEQAGLPVASGNKRRRSARGHITLSTS